MADKLMNIPNDDKQNYHFCRLKLVVKPPLFLFKQYTSRERDKRNL